MHDPLCNPTLPSPRCQLWLVSSLSPSLFLIGVLTPLPSLSAVRFFTPCLVSFTGGYCFLFVLALTFSRPLPSLDELVLSELGQPKFIDSQLRGRGHAGTSSPGRCSRPAPRSGLLTRGERLCDSCPQQQRQQ